MQPFVLGHAGLAGTGAVTAFRLRLGNRWANRSCQPPGRRWDRRAARAGPGAHPAGPARRLKTQPAVSRPSAGKVAAAGWVGWREVMPRRSWPGRGGGGADPAAAVRRSSLRPIAAAAAAAAAAGAAAKAVAIVLKGRDLPTVEVVVLLVSWSLEDMLA